MILVIGGPPGSGKTTVAERWAAARGAVLVSAGTRFRAMAKERGLSLEAFGRAAEHDPSIDRALDAAVLSEIRTHVAQGRDVVVDGRIQAYLLAKEQILCLKVLIDAPLAVRAKRIAGREGTTVEEAKREILARKRAGPTSHQVSAWVRDMFGVPKAGHSGTLDPRVTGVLPVALADATRALEAVLEGDKEYIGVMQIHQDVDERRVRSMMGRFVGEIYQIPPIRSAVKREQRTRHVYELEPLEVDGRNVLFRVRCESGTYIRTLCADIGDALGVGANLVDLRRTRAATFGEADALPLNAFRDAIAYRKEDGDDTSVRAILHPMEDLLRHLPRIVVKDTAVDAICHGANLAVPGVAKLSEHIRVGDLVGVYTGKGEAVAIANALMTSDRIVIAKSGAAADTARVLMAPGTYPRLWK